MNPINNSDEHKKYIVSIESIEWPFKFSKDMLTKYQPEFCKSEEHKGGENNDDK